MIVDYLNLPNQLKQVNPAKYQTDNDIERQEEAKDNFCVFMHEKPDSLNENSS